MHKRITLQVWVKVEGDRPAPEDFEALATAAVRRILTEGTSHDRSGLNFEILKTFADDDPPDDPDESHA